MPPINRITRDDLQTFAANRIGENNALDLYQRLATKSAFYPGQGTALGLIYAGLKLNGEAGEFAEHVGKAMRDDDLMPVANPNGGEPHEFGGGPIALLDARLTPERRIALTKEAGDVLWYLSTICNELGIALSDVAHGNLTKLCDRGERDALQGSGDDR